ncbi:MAG: dinitrogenase iron-molybdenum cofactor biosynthesis protein [Ardenticatenales bacterium]|nr:dinitrogenase iron-molybdenum cofactor biosynthesis protein [Ardenticatenales bacterium]
MMKIVISTSTNSLDGPFDRRFGRAPFLSIMNTETGSWEACANPGMGAAGGAGMLASQFVVEQDVQAAISGGYGPNAYMTLSAADIQMYLAPAGKELTGLEVLDLYRQGKLEQAAFPTEPGRRDSQ